VIFKVFEKNVGHRIHNIFDNEAENKIEKFWKYWSMNGQYISIGGKKAYWLISSLAVHIFF